MLTSTFECIDSINANSIMHTWRTCIFVYFNYKIMFRNKIKIKFSKNKLVDVDFEHIYYHQSKLYGYIATISLYILLHYYRQSNLSQLHHWKIVHKYIKMLNCIKNAMNFMTFCIITYKKKLCKSCTAIWPQHESCF